MHLKVLYVEDDEDHRFIVAEDLARYLEKLNCQPEIDEAGDIESAIELLKANAYHAAVLDVRLPKSKESSEKSRGAGYYIAQQLERFQTGVPIVLVSGFIELSRRNTEKASVIAMIKKEGRWIEEVAYALKSGVGFRTRLLSKFVDPKFAERPYSTWDFYKTQRRFIVVQFFDLRGFTSLCETLIRHGEIHEESLINQILHPYFESIIRAIKLDNINPDLWPGRLMGQPAGVVDKFIGDGVLVTYGSLEDSSLVYDNQRNFEYIMQALLVARMAADSFDVKEISRNINIPGGNLTELRREVEKIYIGCAIDCGPAAVGNMGTEARWHFSGIGRCFNNAAKLEKEARGIKWGPISILLSSPAHTRLEEMTTDKGIILPFRLQAHENLDAKFLVGP